MVAATASNVRITRKRARVCDHDAPATDVVAGVADLFRIAHRPRSGAGGPRRLYFSLSVSTAWSIRSPAFSRWSIAAQLVQSLVELLTHLLSRPFLAPHQDTTSQQPEDDHADDELVQHASPLHHNRKCLGTSLGPVQPLLRPVASQPERQQVTSTRCSARNQTWSSFVRRRCHEDIVRWPGAGRPRPRRGRCPGSSRAAPQSPPRHAGDQVARPPFSGPDRVGS